MTMELRQKLYLLDDYPSEQGPFLGKKPPLVKEVFLKFRGFHKDLLKPMNGTLKERTSMKLTAIEFQRWWANTWIELMSENAIVDKIKKINDRWTVLFKQRKKKTDVQKMKQEFLKDMDMWFCPVSSKVEEALCLKVVNKGRKMITYSSKN